MRLMFRRRAPASVVLLAAFVVLSAGFAFAQFRGGEFLNIAPRFMPETLPDHDFAVCRIMYDRVRLEQSGGGWRTDYPYGEINLSIRLSELTRTRVSFDGPRRPNHYVVRLTDESLFRCPFTIASDVGTVGLSEAEARGLRSYLFKGGFLWVDDFWGTEAWEHWSAEIAKVLDPLEFRIEDIELSDSILHSQFALDKVPQITNIGFWRRSGGLETSERGPDSAEVHFRAIRDAHGRIMVVMTHNTDVADSWEREGEDVGFFEQFSRNGYALGINVLLHAMTH
jgi:hypothetical protein